MKTIEEIREYFAGDHFATGQGMVIDSVEENRAVCSVTLNECHNNAVGHVQGGLVFTLADFAFAVAVNHEEAATVTLDSMIQYVRPATGKRLIATATCEHRSRTICVFRVDVKDDNDVLVAKISTTGYTKKSIN